MEKYKLFLEISFESLMLVLGLETTCDETACSLVEDGKHILTNVIASQADLHAIYGGCFQRWHADAT
ncbi:MAG: hypothetical protein LVR00_00395 [Rhabdochlamydiaceae bacterium]|jgi:tRNA A37 threonylcarbamoyltransferase TsaD